MVCGREMNAVSLHSSILPGAQEEVTTEGRGQHERRYLSLIPPNRTAKWAAEEVTTPHPQGSESPG